jgi:hypothetical protein
MSRSVAGAAGLLRLPAQDEAGLDQAEPLALELGGEGRVVNQGAGLDVALLAAAGEVGAREEGPLAVNGDALGVQAAPGRARAEGRGDRSRAPGTGGRRASWRR